MAILFLVLAAGDMDPEVATVAGFHDQLVKVCEMSYKSIQLMWCTLLIFLPIALVFAESSMSNLQSVSIVAAFPIGFVMILIVWSFLKDVREYIKE